MIYSLIAIAAILILHVYRECMYYKDKQTLMVMVKESHQMIDQCLDRSTTERQQLLDRIQAPSFDHLKQAEVRIIKAQKEEKKEIPYELV